MKFSCDRCDAQYMISDEKVGPKGVRVRCKKCGNVISVRRPLENGAAAEERPAAAAASSAGVGTATQGNLEAELGQAFDHAFGGEATTPAVPAPMSAAAEAAKADAAVSEPGALQLPAGDELPAFAVAAQPARTPAPAAPPAATEWYVAIGQAQVGPLPLEEVRRKWEGADVGPDSLVWRPGMGDWAPLSSVADLAAYLAPFPVAARQARTPTPAPSAYQGAAASPAATPVPGGEVVWKPVGASALAALASEEIATRNTPEPRAERAAVNGGGARSLVEKMDLPDGGGVDPTGAIPLPMKALDTTGEHKMERISSVARGAEEIRHKRSAARGIAVAVVALLLVGGAAAAWLLKGRAPSEPASAPVATAPLPPAPAPEPTPVKPAEPAVAAPATVAAAPAAAEAAKPEPAQPEAPKAEAAPQAVAAAPAQAAPAAETAAPAPSPAPAREAPAPTTRAARREALRKERLAQAAAAKEAASKSAATAAPAPAPEQPRRRRDVLDFESNDAALEAALGTGKPAAGSRSVYVPPPPSGPAIPERVTDSQVNETILGRVSALQQCVHEQKARDADGTGVLKMRWTIAPDGSVRDAKCVTPEFASSPIAKCLSGALSATRFPRSKLGRQDVTFPIKF